MDVDLVTKITEPVLAMKIGLVLDVPMFVSKIHVVIAMGTDRDVWAATVFLIREVCLMFAWYVAVTTRPAPAAMDFHSQD